MLLVVQLCLLVKHILQCHIVKRTSRFEAKPAVYAIKMEDMKAWQPPYTFSFNHGLLADNARLGLLLLEALHWNELEHFFQ